MFCISPDVLPEIIIRDRPRFLGRPRGTSLKTVVCPQLFAPRLLRVFERLHQERGLPDVLRVDNGPEFLAQEFVDWMKDHGILIHYIQPGKPNQNAFIERFNRTYRNEVLNLYLFRNLAEVREITAAWLVQYNEQRPHDALGGLSPCAYLTENQKNSTYELST